MTLSFLAAAGAAPEAVALVAAGREWTYAALAPRIAGEAAWLAARGLTGRRVRVTAELSLDFVVRLWALLEVGAAPILLHPRLSEAERAAVAALDAGAPSLDGEAPAAPAVFSPRKIDARAAAAVVLTSGSSGGAKGVVISRAAVTAAAAASAARLGWRDGDRWLLALPPAHIGGLSVLTRCLLARAAVVLAPAQAPEVLLDIIGRERVTLASLVPTQLARLLELGAVAPPSLRAVLLGGAAAAPALLERAEARGWPVLPTYGLTEACSQVATRWPGTPPSAPAGVGPPLPGVEVRLREGEIEVRGPVLADGVLPSAPLPLRAGGWFATGDLGALDEAGNLHVIGRRDELIITGGEKVAPAEVEAVLQAAPGVREALVFGVPDPVWGAVVAAAVVPEGMLAPAALSAFLAERLAPFKRPRRLALVAALPLGRTGKPDRRAAASGLVAALVEL